MKPLITLLTTLFLAYPVQAKMVDGHPKLIKKEAIENQNMVVVMFYTTWCPYCKQMFPIFKKISEEHPEITFVTVDIEKYNIRVPSGVPYIFLIHEKKPVRVVPGATSYEHMNKILKPYYTESI